MASHKRQIGPIALDLGSHSIRMLQLASEGSDRVVEAGASKDIPLYDDEPADRAQAVAHTIREMLASGGFRHRRAVAAVADRYMQVKSLRLPDMPDDELREAAMFEARERFALAGDDLEFRILPAGRASIGPETQREVIALAVNRSDLQAHLQFLSELKLKAAGLDVVHCSFFRCFDRFLRRQEDCESINAFLDIGYSGSRMVVTRGQTIVLIKSIDIGGAKFDQLASQALSIRSQQARLLRRRMAASCPGNETGDAAVVPNVAPNVAPDVAPEVAPKAAPVVTPEIRQTVNGAIAAAIEQLGREVMLCLRYVAVTFRGQRPDAITGIGGEARNAEVRQRLQEVTGATVLVGDPFRGVDTRSLFDASAKECSHPEWATAVGLAMKPVAARPKVRQ